MKINYRNFSWFDRNTIAHVVDALQSNPEMGRPTLSKATQLSMFKAEKVLEIWRDHDLFQYLDHAEPVQAIIDALELDSEDDVVEETVDEPWDDLGDDPYEVENRYHYDGGKDTYIVTLRLRGKDRIVRVPGDIHRAMRQAYSDWDGDPLTLNASAKEFGVSRTWFQAYKTAMGWTHDSDPFSDEEVAEVDPEELAQRAIQRRRHVLEKRFDQLQSQHDRRDAEKYRNLERSVIEPLVQDLLQRLPRVEPLSPRVVEELEYPFAAVISPSDLHFGKFSPPFLVDDPYDRRTAKERLEDGTKQLLEHLSYYGQPEQIVVGLASDWFHVDNIQQGTTKGTRQDVDGHVWQMVSEGVDLSLWFVETLRQQTQRVRLVVVPGNHDEFSSLFLLKLLEVRYAGCEDVEVIRSVRQRTYLDYGITTMGFTHGHHWKRDMVMKILTEPSPEMLYRTRERIWFTGHKHHEESKDYGGVRWYQLPSLSGDDQWHDESGYNLSRKSLAGYVIRRDQGVVAQLYAPAVT